MNNQQASYRQIMKATSVFGGVQVFNILIAIIRSKFIAILLGPTGMGISGLLTATTGIISALTNFGLGTSAVKNVAEANGNGDQTRIEIIVTVLRRWVWVTGLLGMFVTIAAAPLLSRLTFGNSDYTFPFICIAVSLLLTQLSSGQMVLLQGMRKLQFLAKASLAGSILGLCVTVPLYYLFGIKGIVPAIIVNSAITLGSSWYFARKTEISNAPISNATAFQEGKEMVTMGLMISLSGIIELGASFIVRIFIGRTGGVEQVGLYSAGFAIINTYVGLIFVAMATDYYPRLSAVAYSNELCKNNINQQAEIALLILTPIIILFFVFIQIVVIILYSNKFTPVYSMIQWAALGMLFKAVSWANCYIILAKGDSKLFFWSELIGSVYMLGLNILGYHLFGLTGLGGSFMVGYIFYFIQIFIISKLKYQFSFNSYFVRIFIVQLLLAISCFIMVNSIEKPYSYFPGMAFVLISAWYSFTELDKRLGLKSIIKKFL